jgi:hypothetical protein
LAQVRQRIADPDGDKAECQLADGVDGSGADLAASGQGKRIEAERGKGREPAEDSDNDERAADFADEKARRREESGTYSDIQTADDVDQEDAEGEAGTEPCLDDMVHNMAEECTGPAADRDRQ